MDTKEMKNWLDKNDLPYKVTTSNGIVLFTPKIENKTLNKIAICGGEIHRRNQQGFVIK